MGKYDKIVATLPRLLGTEPAYQQKVEAVKAAILEELPRHASALASEYISIREEKDAAEEVLSEINLRLEAVSQLMSEQFDVEGASSMRLNGKGLVSIYYEPAPKVEDKEAFRLWCLANGLERSMQLWPTTTASLLKERLSNGEPEMDGVTAYARRVIRFTKG